MLYQDNYTEKLIGLKDIVVSNIIEEHNRVDIFFEMRIRPHACPCCQATTGRIHDYRTQVIKDTPLRGKHTYLHYRKRRYVCKNCEKKFYEKATFLPRYHRMTSRLAEYIVNQLRQTCSITSVAQGCNLSFPTICRIFENIQYSLTKLPKVLSIDEFKGNAGGRKYQCILTDPQHKKVLDILEGREMHLLIDYFKHRNDRSNVEYFVMDMWKPYKDLAETYFKHAQIVIDKYHFIRQVVWAFDRVRKEEQKRFSDHRRKYFKKSRFLLLKRRRKLSLEQVDAVEIMLATSSKLRDAYLLKEKFYDFVDSPDIHEAKKNLQAWYLYVHTCQLKEFETCANTIRNWQPYILNSFTCSYTNGYTEGVNNKVKVLKRNAFGVRNFDRFRNRILHMMN